MSRSKTGLSIVLGIAGMCVMAVAQNPPQQSDAERLRVEISERARQEAEQRDWETKIFPIKFVDPDELRRALGMFRSNISYSGGGLRVLSVRAPKEIMPAIEDAIKRLDVPSPRRDAELTIFVVLASDQAEPTSVPSTLQPVMNQLKNVLSYKGYHLLDTLIVRASESRTSTGLSGTVTLGSQTASYTFDGFFRIDNPDGKAPTLHLSQMHFRLQVQQLPGVTGPAGNVGISGEVDIPQGQQVVVGKATMGDRALILVMTSKFPN